MNVFDRALIEFFNQFAQRSETFDRAIVFLSNWDLAKGAAVMSFVWFAWFCGRGDERRNRSILLGAIFGSLAGLVVARALAYTTPFRIRPLLNPALHFRAPLSLPDQSNWTHWSSFPSDHMALFCALAYGVWRVSRRAGIVLATYLAIFIFIPRIYVGIHYPTDLLAGGFLGVIVVALLDLAPLRRLWMAPLDWLHAQSPALFYGLLFFVSYQIASLFYDLRMLMANLGFNT